MHQATRHVKQRSVARVRPSPCYSIVRCRCALRKSLPPRLVPFRKTKLVCTIGPATWDRERLFKLADEGMNVARLNMSHGDHASHKKVC